MLDNQNHFNNHDFSNMDRHANPMHAHEHDNIWYATSINPFRQKNDAHICHEEVNFLKSKNNEIFQFPHGKRQSNMDEVINALGQNKWLRYALVAALMLAAVFSSW